MWLISVISQLYCSLGIVFREYVFNYLENAVYIRDLLLLYMQ